MVENQVFAAFEGLYKIRRLITSRAGLGPRSGKLQAATFVLTYCTVGYVVRRNLTPGPHQPRTVLWLPTGGGRAQWRAKAAESLDQPGNCHGPVVRQPSQLTARCQHGTHTPS